MKIVIGVDDSPCSNRAIEFVRKMSWPRGTRVIVVSAVHVPAAIYADLYVPAGMAAEDILSGQRRAHEEIASRAEARLRGPELITEARVPGADPRHAILETAKTERADLIVVGSHGRSGVAKIVMGSVAAHVVTHAPCSVLVVKSEEAKSANAA